MRINCGGEDSKESAYHRIVVESPSWHAFVLALTLCAALTPTLFLQGQDSTSSPAATSPTLATTHPAAPDNKNSIKVHVEVVNVPVTVLDKRGLPVINLTQKDFEVFEDGKRQTISYFRREPQPPLRIGLILDTSNSARRQLSFEKDAASEFAFNMLRGQNSKNRIFVQTFDETSSIIQDFTNDPDTLNEKIRGLKAGGGKSLYDAIWFACREKMLNAGPPEDTRRVLVLISDGIDVQSQHSFDEAISMAHRAETLIYTIGNAAYGYSNPGDKTLVQISEQTGGAAYFPLEKSPGADLGTGYLSHGQIGETSQNKGLGAETGKFSAERLIQLADALDAINRELDEQYSIGYRPSNATLDGTYRAIKVVALRRGVEVRNKVGYFASAPQE
ncbi:MAG: VWA domain-containing protein [Acidobacteriia bacterium]|nr:VWA domain-containing protein [Terriglobia bacterium]